MEELKNNLAEESEEKEQIKEPQEETTENQVPQDITVLPNSHIPIVLSQEFEFVPFESSLQKKQQLGDVYAQQDNGHNM